MKALVWLVALATYDILIAAQDTCPATITSAEHITTTVSVSGVVTETWHPQTITVVATRYETITETDLPNGLPVTLSKARKKSKPLSGDAVKEAHRRDVSKILATCPDAVVTLTTRTSTLTRGISTIFTSEILLSLQSPSKSNTSSHQNPSSLISSTTPKPASSVLTSGPRPTKSSHSSSLITSPSTSDVLPLPPSGNSTMPPPPTVSSSLNTALSDFGTTLLTPTVQCPSSLLSCWYTPPDKTLSTPSTISFGLFQTMVCASGCGNLWMSTINLPLPPMTVSTLHFLSTGVYMSEPTPTVTAWPIFSYGGTSLPVPAPWTTCPTTRTIATQGEGCGVGNDNKVCESKHCCGSPVFTDGKCGTDKDHCEDHCIIEFGDCWNSARDLSCIASAVIASQKSHSSSNFPPIYPTWVGLPPGSGPPGGPKPPPGPPPPPPGSEGGSAGGSGCQGDRCTPSPPPPFSGGGGGGGSCQGADCGPPPGSDLASVVTGVLCALLCPKPSIDIPSWFSWFHIHEGGEGGGGGGGCTGANCDGGGGGGGGEQYCDSTFQNCEPPKSDNSHSGGGDNNKPDPDPDDDDPECETTYSAFEKTYFCEESTAWKDGSSYRTRPQTCTKTESKITKACAHVTGITTTEWDGCSENTATDVTYSCSIGNRTMSLPIIGSTITQFTTCTATKSATVSGCKVSATTTSIIDEGPISCPRANITITPLDDQGEEGGSCPIGNFTVSPLDPQGEDGTLPTNSSCPKPSGNITVTPDDDQGEDGICSYNRDVQVMDGGIPPGTFASHTGVGYSMTCNGFDEWASALSSEVSSIVNAGSLAAAGLEWYKNVTNHNQYGAREKAICSAADWQKNVSSLEACDHITDELEMLSWGTAEQTSLQQLQSNHSVLMAAYSSVHCVTDGPCLGLDAFLQDISWQYSSLVGEMANAHEVTTSAIQDKDSTALASAMCALSDVQAIATRVTACSDVKSLLGNMTWDPMQSLSSIKSFQDEIMSSWKDSITCSPPTTTDFNHLESNAWWLSPELTHHTGSPAPASPTMTAAPSCIPECLSQMPTDTDAPPGAICELMELDTTTYCECNFGPAIGNFISSTYTKSATPVCGWLVCPNAPAQECITTQPGPCEYPFDADVGWCT